MNDKNCVSALLKINKYIFALQAVLTVFLTVSGIMMWVKGMPGFGIMYIAAAAVFFCCLSVIELYVEKETTVFECSRCGSRFKADMKMTINGIHRNNTHLMRCPTCGEKNPCKASRE